MHYAAAFAKDEIVKLLLSKKADTSITGGVGFNNLACIYSRLSLSRITAYLEVNLVPVSTRQSNYR